MRRPAQPADGSLILVAEDDDDLRAIMALALRLDGYQVVSVRDGQEAADYLDTALVAGDVRPPDVLICDLRMPRCDGMELLARLQGRAALPIIMMTAFGGDDVEDRARRLGAAYLFEKPFDIDDLRTAVANVRSLQRSASKAVDQLSTGW